MNVDGPGHPLCRPPAWFGPEAPVVAVGLFDGVHRGHTFLLGELIKWAEEAHTAPLVVTFDSHPLELLQGRAPPLIITPEHRVQLIKQAGIRWVWLLHLEPEILRLKAEDFLRLYLVETLASKGLLVGFDHRLGSDQADFSMLRTVCGALGLEVRSAPPYLIDGAPVSSTAVRQAIVDGRIEQAERLLGRKVSICGRVVKGKGRGFSIGFPTANLSVAHEAVVPCGVYRGYVDLEGRRFKAAVSIGSAPTFSDQGESPSPRRFQEGTDAVEVHLIGYSGDLMGKWLEVFIIEKLRDQQKFSGTGALVEQIAADIEAIRRKDG